MHNILGKYINGNYTVSIYDDGTKIRENDLDNLTPAFAENCDVCITKCCNGGCNWCYEGCTREGKHADLLSYKTLIDSLHPYTELALNGNDMSHPQLVPFLKLLKEKKVIPNITVNQKHFIEYYSYLRALVANSLIYGIGISLTDSNDIKLYEKLKSFPNAVIHTIAGITDNEDYERLAEHNCKILILGYKRKGRGDKYYNEHSQEINDCINNLKTNLPNYLNKANLISFDNLAIEQLDIRNTLNMTDDDWNTFYMGDDGKYTFYIDLVNNTFAKNSISTETYPIKPDMTVDDMFNFIRSKG